MGPAPTESVPCVSCVSLLCHTHSCEHDHCRLHAFHCITSHTTSPNSHPREKIWFASGNQSCFIGLACFASNASQSSIPFIVQRDTLSRPPIITPLCAHLHGASNLSDATWSLGCTCEDETAMQDSRSPVWAFHSPCLLLPAKRVHATLNTAPRPSSALEVSHSIAARFHLS